MRIWEEWMGQVILKSEIPNNITAIKKSDPKAALELRLKTREQFESLMHQGYVVVGFDHDKTKEKGIYWLAKYPATIQP